jgi:sulfoacetaldehyde dehydrogenase
MTSASRSASMPANADISEVMRRARAAQSLFANVSQERADAAVRALAWSIYDPAHARELAELAVADTGLGNVADKIVKKQRKTFGTLRDLLRARSVGIIEEDAIHGIVKYAKPMGVIAAVTPSTNPGATPVNKAMMAVKGRNAIDALMRAADLVVVTGSQDNVRRAYSSGTPAIGVGVGNVCVLIDESADLDDAAEKICASKIFDNSTSCSSENSLIILDSVYDAAIDALKRAGGYLCTPAEKQAVERTLWRNGKLNRNLIAKDAAILARSFDLGPEAHAAKFFMVEETGIGKEYPLSGEKLSLVLTVYRAPDFAAGKAKLREMLDHQGKGHSVGIHTRNLDHARKLAEDLEVVRVLVNFAHTFGNGGGFDSGLGFTLSMGCGSWQKNSISENLSYRHFLNITHLVTKIPEDRPTEQELFGPHWRLLDAKGAA